MKNRYFIYGGLIIAVLFFSAGCVSQTRVERDYGTSYNLQKFGQTLNPQAEKNLEPVYGFDGQAADKTVVKYEKSFEEKVAAPTYTFSISGGGK
jgi:hypothetical protein